MCYLCFLLFFFFLFRFYPIGVSEQNIFSALSIYTTTKEQYDLIPRVLKCEVRFRFPKRTRHDFPLFLFVLFKAPTHPPLFPKAKFSDPHWPEISGGQNGKPVRPLPPPSLSLVISSGRRRRILTSYLESREFFFVFPHFLKSLILNIFDKIP